MLTRCLDVIPNVEKALKRYEELRKDRTAEIVRKSSEQSKRIHDPILADPVAAENYVNENGAPEKIKQRYDWIFEYDAERVAI